MVLQFGKRLAGLFLRRWIVAAIGVALEQRDGVLVRLDLIVLIPRLPGGMSLTATRLHLY